MSTESMAIIVLLVSFLVMIFLRFPIAYAVALSSLFCLMYQGLSLTTICQQMVKGIFSFSLMAVPFFITMGCLMGEGGISEKLIALANACVGWMRGGMAMVNIVASYFFGGISVGSLFLAGYIPGALLAVTLMIGSYIISVKRNYPKGEKFSIINLLKQLSVSFWALAAVLIVVFGVVGGVFTATESAAIAVIYSLIVSVFIYKGLDWKGVWRVLEKCVDTLSIVLILIATSIGIDPVQFGIMVVLNCGIGLLTPPVGAVLFIGSAVSKVPMERVVKATLPFYICMILTLILITFFPGISLFLPQLLGR